IPAGPVSWCFLQRARVLLNLHSFPTRRSSDLHGSLRPRDSGWGALASSHLLSFFGVFGNVGAPPCVRCPVARPPRCRAGGGANRSEEHTSELQSRENLVCRLLLEKKKKKLDRS